MVTKHLILDSGQKIGAIQNLERGVHLLEHRPVFNRLDLIHWDDLHLFRTVAAASSFRQAAVKLKTSVNTVRARVTRLEQSLGTILFARSRDGISLTADGIAILEVALEMQSLSSRLQSGAGNNVVVQQGELRISCSEGLGEFWLTPKLAELQDRLPGHIVSLQNDFDQNRIHSREYDICIGFAKPIDNDTIVTKLATLHLMMFASEQYLAKFGTPTSINDASDHRFILQNAPGVHSDVIDLFIGEDAAKRLVMAKVNTSHSLYWAIVNGVGIGALPTYARSISKRVRPLDLPIHLKFELWLSFDRSVQASQPVREAIDWLRGCFDPNLYPWFADDFIHPDNFEDKLRTSKVVSLFNLNE